MKKKIKIFKDFVSYKYIKPKLNEENEEYKPIIKQHISLKNKSAESVKKVVAATSFINHV